VHNYVEGLRFGDIHVEFVGTAARLDHVVADRENSDGREALCQAFATNCDALYRFILVRVAGDRDAADDLLQQTCCEAARHRSPPGTVDECLAWLRGIARNLIRRHWRRMKRQAGRVPIEDAAIAGQLVDDLESRPLPADALVHAESVTQLLLAMTELPEADQSLLAARYFDGRSQATIAGDWGVTEKSVESRLYRARGRLRNALRRMGRSGE